MNLEPLKPLNKGGAIIQFMLTLVAVWELSCNWAKVNTERPVRKVSRNSIKNRGIRAHAGSSVGGKNWLYFELTEFAAALDIRRQKNKLSGCLQGLWS